MSQREHDEERGNWPGAGRGDSAQLSRIERLLLAHGRMLMEILRAQGIEIKLELQQMAIFTGLNETVSKLTDLTESFKTMTDGLKAQRDALQVELDALKAADATDQAAVDAAEAKLAQVTATLEAVTAVAAGTPVAASTGGIPV